MSYRSTDQKLQSCIRLRKHVPCSYTFCAELLARALNKCYFKRGHIYFFHSSLWRTALYNPSAKINICLLSSIFPLGIEKSQPPAPLYYIHNICIFWGTIIKGGRLCQVKRGINITSNGLFFFS